MHFILIYIASTVIYISRILIAENKEKTQSHLLHFYMLFHKPHVYTVSHLKKDSDVISENSHG